MMPYYVGIDGGGTKTAVELRTRAAENAIAVMSGKAPEHCMNPEALEAAWAK